MNIYGTNPVVDKGNKFNSHIANASSAVEISMAVSEIKHSRNSGNSTATHNMFAARIMMNGRIQEYTEDDGEFGGARSILREMQLSNIVNRVVVVSRWFSGVHIGSKRFQILTQCTKAAIQVSHAPGRNQTPPTRYASFTFSSPVAVSTPVTQTRPEMNMSTTTPAPPPSANLDEHEKT